MILKVTGKLHLKLLGLSPHISQHFLMHYPNTANSILTPIITSGCLINRFHLQLYVFTLIMHGWHPNMVRTKTYTMSQSGKQCDLHSCIKIGFDNLHVLSKYKCTAKWNFILCAIFSTFFNSWHHSFCGSTFKLQIQLHQSKFVVYTAHCMFFSGHFAE